MQARLTELYRVSVKTMREHLQNIYAEGELEPERTIRKFRIVQMEGARGNSRPRFLSSMRRSTIPTGS